MVFVCATAFHGAMILVCKTKIRFLMLCLNSYLVNLTPGVYVALCHIPDPNTGMAHEELGVVKVFTVN